MNIYKVITQTEAITITRQDGTQTQKSTIVLQEPGGKYENSFVCTLLGNSASLKFYENDLVFASLRFQHNEYQGRFYQDITIQEIKSLTPHN